mgnify:CR=1 FL=1
MKILITGGAGFIGSAVIRHIVENTKDSVINLDKLTYAGNLESLKLVEEVGETCRAILKQNKDDAMDGIGDCVVVLTNLAELLDTSIEECVERAYAEISNRTGKMKNGTFVKDN